jgi:glutamate carboxypeptidase
MTAAAQQQILAAIDAEAPQAVALLEKLVNINSATFNPPGVIAVGKILEPEFQALGFQTRWIPMDAVKRAPHLIAERKGSKGKRVMLIGHLDTVFEPSSPFQKFVRNGDTATGPGVGDMKGGIVVMLSALKALHKTGALENTSITVFLTGDEESAGPPTTISRKEFIEVGKNSDAALCFEGGVQQNGKDFASTARRGATTWELRVKANTGHSSGIFGERLGDGAIFEISRILSQFHDTLREPSLSYSVGMIAGGANVTTSPNGEASVTGKPNIVPAEAVAIGDVRALTPEQLGRVKDKMQSILAKSLPRTSATIQFKDSYPPMAATPGNAALLDALNKANRVLDLPAMGALDPMAMGALDPMLRGAGDISFVAGYVDSLSGLGAYGSGAHAPGETVNLARLPLQSKRAALLIQQLIGDGGR